MKQCVRFGLSSVVLLACTLAVGILSARAAGPLRIHPDNPRYFTDDTGKAILLSGSHTWNNLVDMKSEDSSQNFDYDAYLAWLKEFNHNFFRLWAWELLTWDTSTSLKEFKPQFLYVSPHPWQRTGPATAADGKPKFDLDQLNDDYFNRLKTRVKKAQDQGIYASIMLFEGWGTQFSKEGWKYHPFNPANNINGVDGAKDGVPLDIYHGNNDQIVALQKKYVRRVIDTVNEFDNVLYEISNENHPSSTPWQYDMIRFIRETELSLPKQHPIGMTFQFKGGSNQTLFDSPADWISPNPDGGYRDDPPVADGSKVIVSDTDHLWGVGGNPAWVWKSFMRGNNPIFMDPYDEKVLDQKKLDSQTINAIRQSMGQAIAWSKEVNLADMLPVTDISSTKYCLANPGQEYLIYVPKEEKSFSLDLPKNRYQLVWFNSATGESSESQIVDHAGGKLQLQAAADDSLLHVSLTP